MGFPACGTKAMSSASPVTSTPTVRVSAVHRPAEAARSSASMTVCPLTVTSNTRSPGFVSLGSMKPNVTSYAPSARLRLIGAMVSAYA